MQGKIAAEEHFVTLDHEEYVSSAWMSPAARRRVLASLLDVSEERLAAMDRHGIEIAVLSLAAEGVQAESSPARAIAQAAGANEALAEIVDRHRERFAGLAVVALQDPRRRSRSSSER
ncbi:MAG TPA: hypothetical protein VFD01_10150 [Candidatus Dormibacteraeota bacterium]|nr:hypothetical protein [Candidatus Dormibacteraeota bacterium]